MVKDKHGAAPRHNTRHDQNLGDYSFLSAASIDTGSIEFLVVNNLFLPSTV